MNKMERRDFLKITAMTAATAAAQAKAGVERTALKTDDHGIRWDKAPCRFCGTGCHVKVGVKGGRVVAIAGAEDADVNKGLLCVKGYHVGGILYGKDRLTKPMLRKDGKLEPVSWDEAITVIAERIYKNPKKFAFYGSGQWTIPEGYAAQKFIKGGLPITTLIPMPASAWPRPSPVLFPPTVSMSQLELTMTSIMPVSLSSGVITRRKCTRFCFPVSSIVAHVVRK